MEPYVAAFFFLASGASAYLWGRRLFTSYEPAVRALSGLVLWQLLQLVPVQLVATAQLIGLVERVSIASLAEIQAIILAVSVIWAATHRMPAAGPGSSPGARNRLPLYVPVAVLLMLGSYLVFAIDIFSSFPSGFDALTYHLPLALGWLQSGSLAIPISRAWRLSLPGNAEIGMMVLLATGKDSAVVLVNWVALAVLAISIYLLAKRISHGNRLVGAAITILLLSIPMFEFQSMSAYVDLFGTAFLIAGFALLVHRRDGSTLRADYRWLIFVSAAACGISLGTKPLYDLFVAAYGLLAIFWFYRERAQKPAILVTMAILVIGLLVPSAFWFGRAAITTGNPVFPMRVSIGSHLILPGYASSQITSPIFDQSFVRSRKEWLIYPWTEWKRDPGYLLIPYGEGGGLGALYASLVPVGLAFLVYRSWRQPGRHRSERALLLALAVSLLVWWFVLSRVPRFGLPIVVLTCLLTAPLIELLQARYKRPFKILLVGALVITCTISSFVPFHTLVGRIASRHWARSDFYSYPGKLDNLPSGSCVINYTHSEENNFALAGAGLHNRVIPGFEVPNPLTPEFLQSHRGDFVAEIVPDTSEWPALSTGTGVQLVSDQRVRSGPSAVHWRLWEIEP